MCLVSVYTGEERPENLVLTNVQRIEWENEVVAVDLMGRKKAIEGRLSVVDFAANIAIIQRE